MSHEQKDSMEKIIKKPVSVEQQAGILKDKERSDLENQIVSTLKSLNSHMTKKEILALIHRIEVGKGLEGLRSELQKEKKLEWTDISDDVLQDILSLFREVEQIVESRLKELKLELSNLNESKEYTIDKAAYLSAKFPWIKKLEESKLGENTIIDIAGMGIGAFDSAHVILKFLLTLLRDLVMLPKQILDEVRKK